MAVAAKKRARIIPETGIPSPEQIRKLREEKGFSLEEAAAKVGVKPLTWYGWETPSQRRRPSPSHAILLRLLEDNTL